MINPYWGTDFFSFFGVLAGRIWQFATGHFSELAADELQIAVLGAIAICCGVIGPFLVLKRMTLFANSLSHTILLGLVVAFLIASKFWGGEMFDFSTLFIGAMVAALVTAFFTEGLVRFFQIAEDASIGLVFTSLFALGVIGVTVFTRDVHLGVEAVMGNADVLQMADLKLSSILAFVNVAVVALFFRQFQFISFHRNLGNSFGLSSGFFHYPLLFLAALTCVSAFRAVGVLLVLAFLVGPFLTARLFCHRLPRLLFWSCFLGILASVVGVATARHLLSVHGLAISTGGMVSITIGLFYFLGVGLQKLLSKGESRRRQTQNGRL